MSTAVSEMSHLSYEQLEGRLNAQRQLLISLFCVVLKDPNSATLLEQLLDEETFVDSEEDPGVDPSEAYATEAIAAGEIHAIIEAAKARAAALKR